MNQRLLVILAVLLLIVGAFGLLMSNGTPEPTDTPVSYRLVNYLSKLSFGLGHKLHFRTIVLT